MKKTCKISLMIIAALSAAMAFTACGGEIADKANNALESAQNEAGDAIGSKAADYIDGAMAGIEVPDAGGETQLPAPDSING